MLHVGRSNLVLGWQIPLFGAAMPMASLHIRALNLFPPTTSMLRVSRASFSPWVLSSTQSFPTHQSTKSVGSNLTSPQEACLFRLACSRMTCPNWHPQGWDPYYNNWLRRGWEFNRENGMRDAHSESMLWRASELGLSWTAKPLADLGLKYLQGNEADKNKAERLLVRAGELASRYEYRNAELGRALFMLGIQRMKAGDRAEAENLYYLSAHTGNKNGAKRAATVGQNYYRGVEGQPGDLVKAEKFIRAAASTGPGWGWIHYTMIDRIGTYGAVEMRSLLTEPITARKYIDGTECARDLDKAEQLLQLASPRTGAYYSLIDTYLYGERGAEADIVKAEELLHFAIDGLDQHARTNPENSQFRHRRSCVWRLALLGAYYRHGIGTTADTAKGNALLKSAARTGSTMETSWNSCLNTSRVNDAIGILLASPGGGTDADAARQLLASLNTHEASFAYFVLGNDSVAKDAPRAAELLLRAAELVSGATELETGATASKPRPDGRTTEPTHPAPSNSAPPANIPAFQLCDIAMRFIYGWGVTLDMQKGEALLLRGAELAGRDGLCYFVQLAEHFEKYGNLQRSKQMVVRTLDLIRALPEDRECKELFKRAKQRLRKLTKKIKSTPRDL